MVKLTSRRKLIACIVLMAAMVVTLVFQYSRTLAYTEKQGTINGTYVNIRTSAGTAGNTNKLVYSGKYVQLNVGHNVTITGEARASDGALWYKIKFNYTGGVELNGYVHSAYVDVIDNSYTADVDFEAYMTKQGFPESYKAKLRQLHTKYPNWVFVADNLSYDWNTAVKAESMVGRSLVSKSSISSWKSLETGSYNWETGVWATFDGGAWVAASEKLVAYCMDPRNFLDETQIFQFEMLSFNSGIHKESNVETLLNGTFMSNANVQNGKTYAQAFMDAASQSGVSPYHLVSRVIQEVGTAGTTGGVTGYYAPSTGNIYSNLYNFYNIGAYATSSAGAIENGLIYASKTDSATQRPWNTKYKAIVGGALYIGKGYINVGQDTLYYEKFDFAGTPYTHQYMTNVLAPKSEAVRMAKAYTESMKKSISLVFKIPVFKNMPSQNCECPSVDGSPNNVLSSLKVDGYSITPTFAKLTQKYDLVVENKVESVKIIASALDSTSTITGAGNIALKTGSNTINIIVTAQNGDKRTYTVTVVRKTSGSGGQTTTEQTTTEQVTTGESSGTPAYKTSYTILNNDYITGIAIGTITTELQKKFTLTNCKMTVYKSDGTTKYSGVVGTGNIVIISDSNGKLLKKYSCIVFGDINGDGDITILDMLYQKRDILEINKLSGVKAIAADVNRKDGIGILDMLYVKRHILGISSITQ